jgi:hypothetical protein
VCEVHDLPKFCRFELEFSSPHKKDLEIFLVSEKKTLFVMELPKFVLAQLYKVRISDRAND